MSYEYVEKVWNDIDSPNRFISYICFFIENLKKRWPLAGEAATWKLWLNAYFLYHSQTVTENLWDELSEILFFLAIQKSAFRPHTCHTVITWDLFLCGSCWIWRRFPASFSMVLWSCVARCAASPRPPRTARGASTWCVFSSPPQTGHTQEGVGSRHHGPGERNTSAIKPWKNHNTVA